MLKQILTIAIAVALGIGGAEIGSRAIGYIASYETDAMRRARGEVEHRRFMRGQEIQIEILRAAREEMERQ